MDPNYCPKCGDDVLVCPNCDRERPDAVPSKETLELCKQALASLEARKGEDIDAWAEKLARAVVPDVAPPPSDAAPDEHREFWLRWCRDFFILESGIAGPHVPWLVELLHAHPPLEQADAPLDAVHRQVIAAVEELVKKVAHLFEDAPGGPTVAQIAKILCPGYNHTQRGLRTPAETKPDLPCRRCLVWAEGVLNSLEGDET